MTPRPTHISRLVRILVAGFASIGFLLTGCQREAPTLVSASASAAATPNSEGAKPESAKPHHATDGFVNSDGSRIDPPLIDVLKFWWEMATVDRPALPADIRPKVPDIGFLQSNRSEPTLTWIGHMTVLMQIGGLNVLTDPQFSQMASPVSWAGPKRRTQPAMLVGELPKIDVVLITHDHYDHLDEASVRALAARHKPMFLVPLGIDRLLAEWGVSNVRALDWGDSTVLPGSNATSVSFDFVPAHHWAKRGLFDANENLWGGFVVRAPGFTFYFSGDTGYSDDFKAIGEKFGPIDLAVLPVGAYEPRWFMHAQHIDPSEAVQIHKDVRAKRSIAVHWGSFDMATEAIDAARTELPKAVAAAGLSPTEFTTIEAGQTQFWRAAAPTGTPGNSRANPKRQWAKGEPR